VRIHLQTHTKITIKNKVKIIKNKLQLIGEIKEKNNQNKHPIFPTKKAQYLEKLE
jgi:hypothetical protein